MRGRGYGPIGICPSACSRDVSTKKKDFARAVSGVKAQCSVSGGSSCRFTVPRIGRYLLIGQVPVRRQQLPSYPPMVGTKITKICQTTVAPRCPSGHTHTHTIKRLLLAGAIGFQADIDGGTALAASYIAIGKTTEQWDAEPLREVPASCRLYSYGLYGYGLYSYGRSARCL